MDLYSQFNVQKNQFSAQELVYYHNITLMTQRQAGIPYCLLV